MKAKHCSYCGETELRLYKQKGIQTVAGKTYPIVFYKCKICNAKHKSEWRYRKMDIAELDKLRWRLTYRLNIISAILSKKMAKVGI